MAYQKSNNVQIEKTALSWAGFVNGATSTWNLAKGIGGAAIGGAKDLAGALAKTPDLAIKLGLTGAFGGAVAAGAWDILRSNVTNKDPEEKLNEKIESIYKSKMRETEDAAWISRVRAMRDDLRRNYKKMPLEEYTDKYNKLMAALEEKA